MKKISFTGKPGQNPLLPMSPDDWVAERAVAPTHIEPTKRLTIDMPESLHHWVKSQCALKGIKMADVVRDFFEKEFPMPNRTGGSTLLQKHGNTIL